MLVFNDPKEVIAAQCRGSMEAAFQFQCFLTFKLYMPEPVTRTPPRRVISFNTLQARLLKPSGSSNDGALAERRLA